MSVEEVVPAERGGGVHAGSANDPKDVACLGPVDQPDGHVRSRGEGSGDLKDPLTVGVGRAVERDDGARGRTARGGGAVDARSEGDPPECGRDGSRSTFREGTAANIGRDRMGRRGGRVVGMDGARNLPGGDEGNGPGRGDADISGDGERSGRVGDATLREQGERSRGSEVQASYTGLPFEDAAQLQIRQRSGTPECPELAENTGEESHLGGGKDVALHDDYCGCE